MKRKLILSLVLTLFAVFLIGTVVSFAETYQNFTYEVIDGEAIITGYIESDIMLKIPSSMLGYPVTKIADNAFEDQFFDNVEIPDSVISIGDSAFKSCVIETCIIGKGVKSIGSSAFEDIVFIDHLTIPANVEYMGERAFAYCGFDSGITILAKSIGNNAFSSSNFYNYLTSIDGVEHIGNGAFRDSDIPIKAIPGSVKTIGDEAFANCWSLKNITIEGGVIGNRAFAGCTSLQEVNIKEGVTSIGDGAFEGCEIESITIPGSVRTMGDGAFANCWSLKNITIECETIGNRAFADCISLQEVNIKEGVTSIGDGAFSGCGLESITISGSVKTIGTGAFKDCHMLESITIPGNIKTIGTGAFKDCHMLGSITINEGVETIGASAFEHCDIRGIDIPGSVKTIGDKAFKDCYMLGYITINEGVETIGAGAFEKCSGGEPDDEQTLIIPDSVQRIGARAFALDAVIDTIKLGSGLKHIGNGAFLMEYLKKASYNGTREQFRNIEIELGNDNIIKLLFPNDYGNYYVYQFVDYDGTILKSGKAYVGTVLNPPSEPERPATPDIEYTFDRWDGFYDGIVQTNSQMIFTAIYIESMHDCVCRFVDDDGTLIEEKTVKYGDEVTLPEEPTKTPTQQYTYIFRKWDGYTEGMEITDDITFAAMYWKIFNQYTYKFVDNDGTVLKEQKADYGTVIEEPQTPADKDPYTFDYWQGYEKGMKITEDISFEAAYKYKTYRVAVAGLNKTYNVVYNDAFKLEVYVPDEDCSFKGYFTNENGQGTKITDENGESITTYNYLHDIIIYPYYINEALNTITVYGNDSAVVGSSGIVRTVYFSTDKAANYLVCTVKYPEDITLNEVIAKEFAYVSEETKNVSGGYVYQKLVCTYTENLDNMPVKIRIMPFELVFDIPATAKPQNAEISITNDSVLMGEKEYTFDHIVNGCIEILPKNVEKIEISGDDEIVLENGEVKYSVNITPDWATNTEIEWSVSDETIATVSKEGILHPLSAGTVTLTAIAKDGSGVYSEKVITVKELAKITSVVSDCGQWDKEFSSDIREYTVYVPYDTESISFKPSFSNGIVVINGFIAANDKFSTVKLSADNNIIVFKRNNVAGYENSEYKITVKKLVGTVTSVSDDGKSFSVNIFNVETGKTVILALFNDGRFVEMQMAVFDGTSITFTTTLSYTDAKIMAWDRQKGIAPLCLAEKIKR